MTVMEENMIRKNMWNDAGKAGLALGAVSTAYMFAGLLIENAGSVFMSLLFGLVWIAKFGGCIWLMMFFMKKFAAENPEADNKDTRRFGVITALLSAIVYSAASFANVAFISADLFAEQTELMMQQMAPMMDSNTLEAMNMYMENLPELTFISNLIYCFIFGAIISAILSRNIPSRNPFADYKPDEQ